MVSLFGRSIFLFGRSIFLFGRSIFLGAALALFTPGISTAENIAASKKGSPGTQPAVSDHSLTPPESLNNGRSTKTTFDDERDANMGENLGNPVLRESAIGRKKSTVSSFGLSADRVREAQESLSQNGHAVAVDGVMGSETTRALRAFQADKGLRQTGTLDRETLSALELDTDRTPASVEEQGDMTEDLRKVK